MKLGFHKVPVTKGLLMGTVGVSLISSLFNWKYYMHLQVYPHITSHNQFWRIILSQVAFSRSGEVLVGAILLYQFRILERLYGSPKYASFLVYSTLGTAFLQVGALIFGRSLNLVSIPSGPYAIFFSILCQYYASVPAVYKFRILGIPIGNKFFVYSLAAQLLVSRAPSSFAAALCGLLTGISYRFNFAGAKKRRLPKSITDLTSKFLLSLLESSPPKHNSFTRQREDDAISENSFPNFANSNPTAAIRETMPSSLQASGSLDSNLAQIEELQSMFPHLERDDIVQALFASHNNLNNAAATLLEIHISQ